MEQCGCYDPGFILGLLTGAQNSRGINVWLQKELENIHPPVEMLPLTEKDIVWMGERAGAEGLEDVFSLSRAAIPGLEAVADLSLDVKNLRGLKGMLEEFLPLLTRPVRIINLVFPAPGSDAMQSKIHLMIRLLRAILLNLKSDVLLLPNNTGSGIEREQFWGNTLNEAQLVYNDDLPRVLLQCLNDGDASVLTDWAGMLHLPGTNVAYFNYLSFEHFLQKEQIFPALAVSLALSGLAGIGDLPHETNTGQIRQLLQARQKSSVFQPASAQMVIQMDKRVFALLKISTDAQHMVLCLVNLSADGIQVYPNAAELGLPEEGWVDLISSQPGSLGQDGVGLAGYSAVWLSQAV